MDDHYEALGLEPTATLDEIKKAFRQLALQYHPDQHPTPIANAIFRRLNEAYLVLSDPEKRKAYDEDLRRKRMAPRGQPAEPSREAAPSPAQQRADSQRLRREAEQRKDYAYRRAKVVQGVSARAVRQTDAEVQDLFRQAEVEVDAEEKRQSAIKPSKR
jgi:curved DNA-binding protein CbpA